MGAPRTLKRVDDTVQFVAALKGSARYQAWFHRLVKHAKARKRASSATDVIGEALDAYARTIGFEESPPRVEP